MPTESPSILPSNMFVFIRLAGALEVLVAAIDQTWQVRCVVVTTRA
jgi:hypothetical protein